MLEPKLRPMSSSIPLLQIGLLVCGHGPAPEDWENYLVLSLIDKQQFLGQPLQFQKAYADVVLRLRSAGLLIRAEAKPVLTQAGRAWMDGFSAIHL